MNTQTLILFIVLNVVNVILGTVKSLITINGTKLSAAFANMINWAFYTVVLVQINSAELSLLWKVIVVGVCNFFGVYIVKLIEEKLQKDRLWKIELITSSDKKDTVHNLLNEKNIEHNYIENIGNRVIFNCYCSNKKDSQVVEYICRLFDLHYFITENKHKWDM